MSGARLAYFSILSLSLGGCGVTVPECSDDTVQALVLDGAKTRILDRLLSEKATTPGFRMMAQLGEDAENTPPEIASQVADGRLKYATWMKYRGTFEWIGVLVKQVDVEWEAKYANGDNFRLDSIQTGNSNDSTSGVACTAGLYAGDNKMPISYTAQRADSGDSLSVEIVSF